MAENVSIAYDPDVWQNDMIFKVLQSKISKLDNLKNIVDIDVKDQDDCSKRLLCELNAKAAGGATLTQNEELIAQVYYLKTFHLFVCLFRSSISNNRISVEYVNPGFWEEQQP